MAHWTQLDAAPIPGGGTLKLLQRGESEFSITLGHNELMNSRLRGSEEALATLAAERLGQRPRPRFLIGGLGMGFTLRAALAVLPADAEIIVAELIPQVVAWARGPLAAIFAGCLDDPRVSIREGDVASLIRAGKSGYDAILLDVDNGPDGLMVEANDRLYDFAGLAAAKSALRKGGVLAIWSAGPDRAFTERLRMSGFAVGEKKVRANASGGGARHVIWLATAAAADRDRGPPESTSSRRGPRRR
jgi:spermidine synthase